MRNRLLALASCLSTLFILACDDGLDKSGAEQAGELCAEGAAFPAGQSFLGDFGIEGGALETLPIDVRCFAENAAVCEHFAGEEGNEEREQAILRALDKYCGDAQSLAVSLKNKYAQNPDVMKILSVCDPGSTAVCSSRQ
ncbi:MAG: hypothetical protein LBT71_02605 [Azoarcus sp.]|jgi:hypothetical protein|nr:hypothetical protein [Azoarcus sp.]